MQREHKSIALLFLLILLIIVINVNISTAVALDTEISTEITATSGLINQNIKIVQNGVLIIPAGVTLTFSKFVYIKVENGGRLQIEGNLVPEGYPNETSQLDGWQGIINNGGTIIVQNALIWGAEEGLRLDNGTSEIIGSRIEYCNFGVRMFGGSTKILSNIFKANGDGISLDNTLNLINSVVPICGNTFTGTTEAGLNANNPAINLRGNNNVDIRFNSFTDQDHSTILIENSTDNSQVRIAFNNFYHNRQFLDPDHFFVVENRVDSGTASPVDVFNCYWVDNGFVCTTLEAVQSHYMVPGSDITVNSPRALPVSLNADNTTPSLVEVSPTIALWDSDGVTVTLTVIIRDGDPQVPTDIGLGIDPTTVKIFLVNKANNIELPPATVDQINYSYNNRGYVFKATITLNDPVDTAYYWRIEASDFAEPKKDLPPNAASGYTLKLTDVLTSINTPNTWNESQKYYLITIPLHPNHPNHMDALGLTRPDTRLARYQNSDAKYVYNGEPDFDSQPFKPGEGFWIKFGAVEDIVSNPGRPIEGRILIPNDYQNQTPYSTLELTPGWYLIGNPFSHIANLSLANMSFTYKPTPTSNLKTERWVGAVSDGAVSFGIWGYNPNTGNYYFERDNLESWKGYWIRVKKNCTINYYLEPYLGTGVTSLSWDMQLTTTQSGQSDSANYIGLMSAAKAEVDVFDSEKPPAMSSGIKSFLQPTGTVREFGVDLRSSNAAKEKWRYVVTGLSPGEARISWNGLGNVPQNYQLILKDNISGAEIDLRKNSSYAFTVTTETRREFDIVMQDVLTAAIQFSVISLEHNPFSPAKGQSVQINYHLSAAATLDVKVYDWVGNLVYVYQPINAIGDNNITWNGRNNRGQLVANGVYFCKINARNNSDNSSQIIKLAVIN